MTRLGFTTVELIRAQLAKGEAHPLGMAGVMLQHEVDAGRRLVQPGTREPFAFSAEDWDFPQVVTYDGREVRICLINARDPGHGAFRRLVDAIQAAGLTPVVVAPVGETMPAIMKRWRWKRRRVGRGWAREEQWRP